MEKVALDNIGDRLASLHEGRSRLKFAKEIEVSDSTLGNYERNDRVPDAEFLVRLRQRTGVDINWLLTGEGQKLPSAAKFDSAVTVQASPERDFVALPYFDVRASAGTGLIAIDQMAAGEVSFERSFLRDLGGAPDYCFMMWANGPSMMPTIHDGSLMIVDSSKTVVDNGCIYVFSVGNDVVVKRGIWRLDGKLELSSDNKEIYFPVEVFDANRVEDLVVVGRVIFAGRTPI